MTNIACNWSIPSKLRSVRRSRGTRRTDVKKLERSAAQFELDGPVRQGARGEQRGFPAKSRCGGRSLMFSPGKSFVIVMTLDQAVLSFEWLFVARL